MQEQDTHSLRKEVPGHLLQFEEKIFGMSLTQLLSDLGAGVSIVALTASMPLGPHIVIGTVLMIVALILVHARIGGYTMLVWLFLVGRSRFLPAQTVFRQEGTTMTRGEPGPVQENWIELNALDHGVAGVITPRKNHDEPDATYWAVFGVNSLQQVRFLAEAEQARIYGRFKLFLDGLGFPVKFLSLVEPADPERDPALARQRESVEALKDLPHLQTLQRASLLHQQGSLKHCTTIRHLLVVSASTGEVARLRTHGGAQSPWLRLIGRLLPNTRPQVSREQVRNELRIRVSIMRKALARLDVQARLLEDAAMLRAYVSCLVLGTPPPPFKIEVLGDVGQTHAQENGSTGHTHPTDGAQHAGPRWLKRIEGVHGAFVYRSANTVTHFEPGAPRLADLVAPSSVALQEDAVLVTVRGEQRYQRYYEITGFAEDLRCGWQEELTSLGLPMIVMTRCHPLDSRFMIKRLELHLVKLESQKLADQKALRLVKADQQIEAEQVRSVMEALARKKLTIFAVQTVIGIHAGSKERLEERASFLLSHLRDLQLRVRPLSRQHDRAWQACLPADRTVLDTFTNLPSDALSTFMNWSSGAIGTRTGAYIGTTGAVFSQRPVYFNPWDEAKRLPNPHVVICGESGMGKSWLAKTLVMGLISANIADAIVLDRDGDYDAIHDYLRGESQRFNLAGACPLNIMDLPYGPADVSLSDSIDLLAESIDNHLLIGLSLLYGEPFAKAQEAFLTHAAREAYAAKGITGEAIRRDPQTLLREPPVFADLLAAMKDVPASSESDRVALLERFEHVAYLFPGQTTVEITCPLTIFNITTLDEKWYPLLIYVVQNFLHRHRAVRGNARYLAYVVEEASYMLKHPEGRRYLENGSRGFRKRGIAQFTLSQHPEDFLTEGKVIIGNAGTCFFLGMQRHTARTLHLADELERVLEEGVPGRAIMRCGREYAAIDVARLSRLHRALFTTDPRERRLLSQQRESRSSSSNSTKGENTSCLN